VPFYAFGTMKVVPARDLDALGPPVGEPVTVNVPIWDSLRSVYLWFGLLALLLRKANRSRAGWSVLAPLLAVYVVLGVAERLLNAYFIFNLHQYLCSIIGDLLRFLAVSLAVLLSVADLLPVKYRLIRFLLVFLMLLVAGVGQVASNAWPMFAGIGWAICYGVFLFIFLAGQSGSSAILGRLFRGAQFARWRARFCLGFGLGPILVLGGLECWLSGAKQLQSRLELFRLLILLSAALCLPYVVFYGFMVLARRNQLYSARFARAFGEAEQPAKIT